MTEYADDEILKHCYFPREFGPGSIIFIVDEKGAVNLYDPFIISRLGSSKYVTSIGRGEHEESIHIQVGLDTNRYWKHPNAKLNAKIPITKNGEAPKVSLLGGLGFGKSVWHMAQGIRSNDVYFLADPGPGENRGLVDLICTTANDVTCTRLHTDDTRFFQLADVELELGEINGS